MSALLTSLRHLVVAVAVLALPACRTAHQIPPIVEQKPVAPLLFEWNGDTLSGPIAMSIDLSEQKAEITRGGEPAGWTYVATGVSRHPTPQGSFRITEKVEEKYSSSWGKVVDADGNTVVRDARSGRDAVPAGGRFVGAHMPFWMRIHGAIGMHAGPIPHPGLPASHGCIRLPRGMAEILFRVTVLGTPVKVVP